MYVTALWQLQSSEQTESNTAVVLLYGAPFHHLYVEGQEEKDGSEFRGEQIWGTFCGCDIPWGDGLDRALRGLPQFCS